MLYRSTHNTRIERTWVEVGRHFGRPWRAFFTRLERAHRLDYKDPHHLWLLHQLFLQDINNDCRTFQDEWNVHPISGPDTHDQSPNDLRLLGQTEHGLYKDDCEDVHPDVISQYYGVSGRARRRADGETGAGHDPEESDLDDDHDDASEAAEIDDDDLAERVAADQEHHIRHEAVDVARSSNPFPTDEFRDIFWTAFHTVHANGTVPTGFGLLENEWEGGEYMPFEILRTGKKGKKELRVALPGHIWRPRAEKWGRALDLMLRLQQMLEDNG
ncbi:hypothetical protein PLICRDRAFT_58020 [Plicaturopsis crispa FD-325 SS-3]|uniref:Integrase core domain-containing protein n=1 Tax=Plicaturopsis crispa FD-325 SS-3 TaxID=944288 RepID=A0A0C9T4L6_PLICR|nr:hypothetical protein PLICRDRAFT_58020 [Plicaturopsis crispa FD-325 SS-3]